MNQARAEDALRMLAEQAAEREHEHSTFSTSREQLSDDEVDAESPIMDAFYNSDGSEGIMKIIKITPAEFRRLYSMMCNHIMRTWNVGRGQRSTYKLIDVLFMNLAVLKYGGSRDQLARMFNIKSPTFMRLITNFMTKIEDFAVERLVTKYARMCTMVYLRDQRSLFKNFPYALEAVDVTFQQANRPPGNMEEVKSYFSGNHKLHGYKAEVTVRPNGIAVAFRKHYPGSQSDINIMHEGMQLHTCRLEKTAKDDIFEDEYILSDEYPNHWAVLVDKGYQGAAEEIRAIVPKKNPFVVFRVAKMKVSTENYHQTG